LDPLQCVGTCTQSVHYILNTVLSFLMKVCNYTYTKIFKTLKLKLHTAAVIYVSRKGMFLRIQFRQTSSSQCCQKSSTRMIWPELRDQDK